MTGLRERNRVKRHNHIVATAWSLFATKGYDATSMEEIAQAADVSAGTLYNFFGTKGALLTAVLEKDLGNVAEQVEPFARQATSAGPQSPFMQMIRFLLAAADKHPKEMRRKSNQIALNEAVPEKEKTFQSYRILREAIGHFFSQIEGDLERSFTAQSICTIFTDIVFAEYLHYLLNESRPAQEFLERVEATTQPLWAVCLKHAE